MVEAEYELESQTKSDEESGLQALIDEYQASISTRNVLDEEALAIQQQIIKRKLQEREKRKSIKQQRQHEILMKSVAEAEKVEKTTLESALAEEERKELQLVESEFKERLSQAESDPEKKAIEREKQEQTKKISNNWADAVKAHLNELHAKTEKKRLQLEEQLTIKQHGETQQDLREQEKQILQLEKLVNAARQQADAREAESNAEFLAQKEAAERKIMERRSRRQKQQEQSQQKLEAELRREEEAEMKRLREESQRREEELKAKEREVQQQLDAALKEQERQCQAKGEELTELQRAAVFAQFEQEKQSMAEVMQLEALQQQQQAQTRLEERRRKKAANLAKKQQEALLADLEKDERDLQVIETATEALATPVSTPSGTEPVRIAVPPELTSQQAALEADLSAKKEAAVRAHKEEIAATEKVIREEVKRPLARLKKDHQANLKTIQESYNARISSVVAEADRKTLEASRDAEVDAATREYAKMKDELEFKARRSLDRMKLQKISALEKAHIQHLDELEAEFMTKEKTLFSTFLRDAEKKTILDAAKEGNMAAADTRNLAMGVMKERHVAELQRLDAEEKRATEKRLQVAAADIKSRYEEAKQAIQEAAEDKEREMTQEVSEARRTEVQQELHQWAKQQVRTLKALMEREAVSQRDDIQTAIRLEFAERRTMFRATHLQEIASAGDTANPDWGMLQVPSSSANRSRSPASFQVEDLSAFKEQIRQQAEEGKRKLEEDKKVYEEQLRRQMQEEMSAYAAKLELEKKQFEESLERQKEVLAAEQQAMLTRKQSVRQEELRKELGGQELTKDDKEEIMKQHQEDMDRLKSHLDLERAQQTEEIRRQFEKKRQQKLAEKQRKQEAALKKHQEAVLANVISVIQRPFSPGRSVPDGRPESRWKKLATKARTEETQLATSARDSQGLLLPLQSPEGSLAAPPAGQPLGAVSTPPAQQQQGQQPGSKADILVIPECPTLPTEGSMPSAQDWVDAVMRSPLLAKVTEIEELVRGQARLLSAHLQATVPGFQDELDRATPCEGTLKVIAPEQLTSPQLVAHEYGQFVISALRSRDPALPEIELCVASALPGPQQPGSAFRNSVQYDAQAHRLYVRDTRLATVGDLLLVLVHCLAHLKADGMAAGHGDLEPGFMKEFYGLSKVLCEELFLKGAAPGSSASAARGQLMQRLEQRMQGLSLPAKRSLLKETLSL
eukprot:RCo017101